MTKYIATIQLTSTYNVEVEADDVEAAWEVADDVDLSGMEPDYGTEEVVDVEEVS